MDRLDVDSGKKTLTPLKTCNGRDEFGFFLPQKFCGTKRPQKELKTSLQIDVWLLWKYTNTVSWKLSGNLNQGSYNPCLSIMSFSGENKTAGDTDATSLISSMTDILGERQTVTRLSWCFRLVFHVFHGSWQTLCTNEHTRVEHSCLSTNTNKLVISHVQDCNRKRIFVLS